MSSDLISRQALCDDLREYKVYPVPISSDESEVKGYNDGIDLAISIIAEFPSAELKREIIHCKDCKFYTPMNRKLKTGICAITMHHLGDDGFCSDAERRSK